ncbi:nucleotidyltransferase domain-containing protein [Candidatus Woesearchaeota archaeon]|nr:nucleotidyltransferase domain-containing protein [Candidatus Woesearchaeota archaeon]
MLTEFEKYKGIKILKFFIFNPTKHFYLREIARKLKISTSTTKHFLDIFVKESIVSKQEKGNLSIFQLNNKSVYVKQLKKTFALLYFKKAGIETITNKTLAIYGSYATGEFDEKSDLDLLVIGSRQDINYEALKKFEKTISTEVQLTIIPYYKWGKMKKNKDSFAMEVLLNHVLIKGQNI